MLSHKICKTDIFPKNLKCLQTVATECGPFPPNECLHRGRKSSADHGLGPALESRQGLQTKLKSYCLLQHMVIHRQSHIFS